MMRVQKQLQYGCTLPLECLHRGHRWFAVWGISDFYSLGFNFPPRLQTNRISSETICIHTCTQALVRCCDCAFVCLGLLSAVSRVILHFGFFIFSCSPSIFLRPVAFKETEVKHRTKELENKSLRYLQPWCDPDTFQLYILPFALFPDPLCFISWSAPAA